MNIDKNWIRAIRKTSLLILIAVSLVLFMIWHPLAFLVLVILCLLYLATAVIKESYDEDDR